ncbi:hypothetical protein [Falsiruegeria mediterranea]|uniref:PD-(D/E)XK nuclease superfamily protein n=1 Tax=Falsiruegeria mediterranea M17 TaxID=1200281 RepID=A0A2R8CAD8_9RHOB|nr:hypothetical protein [Falsiruegeria mediterranea]SPJ29410.1 hypothetical protein TRM7615_02928 [Falsiruegeria mediterranea M17]
MAGIDNVYRDSVRERDLDNFLVEELFASKEFRDWVLSRLDGAFIPPGEGEIKLRKSPLRASADGRQTDVQIGWFERSELRACVLIESKVGSGFTPGQAEAYAQEIEAARDRLGATAAAGLLVAPAARFSALVHDGAFDAELSIEEIAEFLQQRRAHLPGNELALRLEARIELLDALSGKRAVGRWSGGETIEEKRDFATPYEEMARRILPELRVRPSVNSKKATTRIFEGLEVPGLPALKLRHEFGKQEAWKYANIQVSGRADALSAVRASGLLEGTTYKAEKANKSLAIRVITPGIDETKPFHTERHKVEESLRAIRDMIDWMKANSAGLAKVLDQDPPKR